MESFTDYHADALGSIIALTDESGTVKTRYNYSPFGNTELISESSGNPFQYTGRENDGTGLYYYRARYYSPEMGRFISEDPIGFAGGINKYSYVENSSPNFVDPLGLWGVGINVTANAEAGVVVLGAGANYSAGAGIFWGGDEDTHLDDFSNFGTFAGGPGYGPSYPCNNEANVVGGAYAGIGAALFFTNADSRDDLKGTSNLFFVNVGFGPIKGTIQVSVSDNGKFVISIGPPLAGFGYGISGGSYKTQDLQRE